MAYLLRRWTLGTRRGAIQASHLDYYPDQFTFRFSRRTLRSRGKLLYPLAQQAVAIVPVLPSCLRGGKRLEWPPMVTHFSQLHSPVRLLVVCVMCLSPVTLGASRLARAYFYLGTCCVLFCY